MLLHAKINQKIMVGSLLTVLAATTLANLSTSLTFAAVTGSQSVSTEVIEECTFETGTGANIYINSLSGSNKTATDSSSQLVITSNAANGWKVSAEVTGAVTDLTTDGGASGTGFASSLTADNRWNMAYSYLS